MKTYDRGIRTSDGSLVFAHSDDNTLRVHPRSVFRETNADGQVRLIPINMVYAYKTARSTRGTEVFIGTFEECVAYIEQNETPVEQAEPFDLMKVLVRVSLREITAEEAAVLINENMKAKKS